MKKTFLFIILLIFVALIGLLVWFTLIRHPTEEDFEQSPFGQIPASAIDFGYCEKITNALQKESCKIVGYSGWENKIFMDAYTSGDNSLCDFIFDTERKDLCILRIAENLKDESVCDTIQKHERRQTCHDQFTVKSGEFTSCGEIEDISMKRTCFASAIKNYQGGSDSLCKVLSGSNSEQCYEMYYTMEALRTNDYAQCSKISTESGRQYCLGLLPPDTDSDGLSDKRERGTHGTDPNKSDTDGDGKNDGDEINKFYTNPKIPDP